VDATADVRVGPAAAGDLSAVAGALGQSHYFASRLKRQEAGLGTLLVAWLGKEPVGSLFVRLETAEEAEIREHLPDVPILTHVEVRADRRSQRIGTALIVAAELHLIDLGYALVALGVIPGNDHAARLYERLGYKAWEHGDVECLSEEFAADGTVRRWVETCRVMIKEIAPTGRGRRA
jgi:GNAT superfamily N-acetyltransferase